MIWHRDNQVGVGNQLQVDLTGGTTYFQAPEALEIEYARAVRKFCEQEGLRLPDSFREYEELAARAALVRVAEEHQTLDILATREALRDLPDPGYRYSEGYDPHSNRYVCERSTRIGEERHSDTLGISFTDGAAIVAIERGSSTYLERWEFPMRGEPCYSGPINGGEHRHPPHWAVEKSPQAEVTRELER